MHRRLNDSFGHVQISFHILNPTTVELEEIYTRPQKSGLGSKAMQMICDLASDRSITLIVRLPTDFDRQSMDDDAPSERQLLKWYARFGFVKKSGGSSNTRMERQPISTG
jgi:hypothetical protein